MSEITITKDNFEEEILNSNIPVIADFWATWCGPCQMMGPVLSQIAEEYEGKYKVCKINIDENEDLAGKYMIMSIPTLIIFKDGHQVNKHIGTCRKEDILSLLQ